MALEHELLLDAAQLSHVGQVRKVNQDASLIDMGVYAVADGMGGHAAGDIAAALAVEELGKVIRMAGPDDLVGAVKDANTAITRRAASDIELQGMGTTVVALASFIEGDAQQLALVNVGDSRGYRFRDGELEQLTEDHSLVADLVRDGMLRPDQAEQHPQRNVITRALGIDVEVQVDWWVHTPVAGDRFLLCSDGLFNEVPEPVIAGVLARVAWPEDAVEQLVTMANEGGGRDNITVLIIDVVDPDNDDREDRAEKAVSVDGDAAAEATPIDKDEAPGAVSTAAPDSEDVAEPSAGHAQSVDPKEKAPGRFGRVFGRKKGNPSDGAS